MRVRGGAVVALIVLLFVLAGGCTCGRAGERAAGQGGGAGQDAGAPRRGGVLTVASREVAKDLDPVTLMDNPSSWTALHLYDQLVHAREDGTGFEPALAASWDISADGRAYTFHLRPDLKFSDGSPLRASDVRFSLARIPASKGTFASSIYPRLEVLAPDDRTVVIKLEAPYAPLLSLMSYVPSSVLPEDQLGRVGGERFFEAPIGSGPFALAELRRGERVVLRRNPHHWDPERPHVDEVRFVAIPDDATRMLKIQAGEIDIAEDVPASQVEAMRRVPGVSVELTRAARIDKLVFNTRVQALRDVKVRQAIHLALDREALIKTVLFGHGDVPGSFMPPVPYTTTTPYRRDVERARRLLSESASPSGFSARLMFPPTFPHDQVAVLLKSQLEPLGVHLELDPVELSLLNARSERGEFEMRLGTGTSDVVDPFEIAELTVVSNTFWPRATGYSNPEAEALALSARAEMAPARRAELYRELQRIVDNDAVFLALFWPHERTAVRADVHGFKQQITAEYRLWDVWKSP